ncbi:MAG: ArgE/DapE family deacylase [Armatimonadetes bacterium]|nr:ArgE/DapE family deacylase [Armatimonadota bacterium]
MIDRNRLIALLAGLVRENSINPDLVAGAPGEGAIAAVLVEYCRRGGLEAEVREVAPGRANVIARLRGRGAAPALLLNGHIDTVGVEGMTIDPFGAEIREGRLYGRGAFDMKGGVAAMVEAAVAAAERGARPGDVILTMVADEEFASLGTQAVVRDGLLAGVGAAIVTEPTGLDLCVAHKGFAWFTVETAGRAAHGSRHERGVDAIAHMGRVLGGLERLEREVFPHRMHPLVGRPSVHASLIEGGIGLSTFPDRCRLEIERRTLPAETSDDVAAEMEALLAGLRAADPAFQASARLQMYRPGLEVSPDAPVVRAVRHAAERVLGRAPALVGEPAWLDSALLAAAGIPTVIFGPRGEGAHAAVEWVDLESVAAAAEVLAEMMIGWGEENR